MFEVEPNLWLQSLASPALTWAMRMVSELGYEWFYVVLIVVLGFGVRLRPTLGVLLALLLAGIVTPAAKSAFELPRPSDVDVRVLDGGERHTPLVADGGAKSFLALPSQEARSAIRALPKPDYGFISGHVASATAFCIGLLLCFRMRRRSAWALLCAWPLLMAISRMYLGRHFLADALGGLAVGFAAATLAAWLLPEGDGPQALKRRFWGLAAATLALCLVSPFLPWLDRPTLGQLAGLIVVLGLLAWRGFPSDGGRLWQRAARVACLFGLYFVVKSGVGALSDAARWQEAGPMTLPLAAIATIAMFWGGVALSKRLKLFAAPA